MNIGTTFIEDTFAEAFGMRYCRLIVTAWDDYWLDTALREFTGYSASVIACDAETGVERMLSAEETPDGRPGASVLAFGFSVDALAKAVANRTGQCLMTCPTTAVFDGLPQADVRIPLGKHIRFFGDGYQKSKQLDGTRYWRIPVMDGEFVVVESLGVAKGVAGGNLIVMGRDMATALTAARRAVAATAAARRRHHSLSGRSGAERQQGWLALQGPARLDIRCVLSHAAWTRCQPGASGSPLRV